MPILKNSVSFFCYFLRQVYANSISGGRSPAENTLSDTDNKIRKSNLRFRRRKNFTIICRRSPQRPNCCFLPSLHVCPALSQCIGVARGCTGCTCTPPRAEKNQRGQFTGESCKCNPGRECSPTQSRIPICWRNWRDLDVGSDKSIVVLRQAMT